MSRFADLIRQNSVLENSLRGTFDMQGVTLRIVDETNLERWKSSVFATTAGFDVLHRDCDQLHTVLCCVEKQRLALAFLQLFD